MGIAKIKPYSSIADMGLGAFTCAILYVYALSYPPFISVAYLSTPVRVGIEGFTLFLLLIIVVSKYEYAFREAVWFLIVAAVFGVTVFLGIDILERMISSFNKIIFFILAISLFLGNRRILYTCREIWIKLWFVLGALAILAFAGYATHTITFSPIDLAEDAGGTVNTSYYYLHNALLGNLIPRPLFGLDLGRVAGFFFEGGNLGFIFGFNILVAHKWIDDKRRAKHFVWVNLLGGATTLSLTLFFFIFSYFCFNLVYGMKKFEIGIRTLLLLLLGGVLVLAIAPVVISLLVQSSGTVRLYTTSVQFEILANNSWLTWLFGNGIGITIREPWAIGGIDSGLMAILIERGITMLVLMVYVLARCTRHDRWLMVYILYYNCFFDFFWYPLFVLLIAMHYAFSHSGGKLNTFAPSARLIAA